MAISVFDLFKIGIGPSSSHTVGPMRAARQFVSRLARDGQFAAVAQVRVELFGSLAPPARGHGSDTAVMLGLHGESPRPDRPRPRPGHPGRHPRQRPAQPAGPAPDCLYRARASDSAQTQSLPHHPNAMRCEASDASGALLDARTYYWWAAVLWWTTAR